ncbi:MAG TPA: hypothetical protein VGM86_09640 [Thermoanaerobaculia bacterium]
MTTGQRSPDAIGEVVAEIVRYAVEHPEAKDAIEGIHRWWLPGGGERWRPEEVEAALQRLAARGWIEERRLAGRRIWAVQTDRRSEMVSWKRDQEPEERHG